MYASLQADESRLQCYVLLSRHYKQVATRRRQQCHAHSTIHQTQVPLLLPKDLLVQVNYWLASLADCTVLRAYVCIIG